METTQDLLANPWARYIIAAGLVGVSLYLWDKLSQSAPKQAIKYGVPHTEATNDSCSCPLHILPKKPLASQHDTQLYCLFYESRQLVCQ
jgi:hypothetical protein